jgi:hypothetical protein
MEMSPKAVIKREAAPPVESFEHRFRKAKEEKTKEKLLGYRRKFLY